MIDLFDEIEFRRWFEQAEQTLRSAEHDAAGGFWNWTCFKAEQSSQFAIKGLLRAMGEVSFGHSLTRLIADLERLGIDVPEYIRVAGRNLEREYIPSRYADAYPSGSPYQFYDAKDAEASLTACKMILDFVREVADLARSSEAKEGSTG